MNARPVLLVTGATGALGRSLAATLSRAPDVERVYAMTHVAPLDADSRLRVMKGDITAGPDLGLGGVEARKLAGSVTGIIHAAAETGFAAPPAAARKTNVEGTRHLLEFAVRCRALDRIVALSTTHVAGRRSGVILEEDLDHDAGFVNTYEASKYAAERELRSLMSDLPIAVCRLSTVVGDSRTGAIGRRGAIHQAVLFMYAGLAPMIPGQENSPVDFIALDHAVQAIVWLATSGFEAGRTWHLCAGSDAIVIGELLDLTMTTFLECRPAWRKRSIERPALVDLPTFELFCRSVEQVGDSPLRASTAAVSQFAPQLAFPKHFDDRVCRTALAGSGIAATPVRDLWCRVVQHLIEPEPPLLPRLMDFVRRDLLRGRSVAIDADTYLFDDGLVDSLKVLQLIAFVEMETGRPIPDREIVMEHFRTVRTITRRFGGRSS